MQNISTNILTLGYALSVLNIFSAKHKCCLDLRDINVQTFEFCLDFLLFVLFFRIVLVLILVFKVFFLLKINCFVRLHQNMGLFAVECVRTLNEY